MYPELNDLSAIVVSAAEQELLPGYEKVGFECKADGSLVTEVDLSIQRFIQAELKARWPQYGLLGEEMTEQEQQVLLRDADQGLWCLDPLDGTSNFAAGLPFFSISLALLVQGRPILGLVYDPMRKECFTAERGKGAWLNGQPLVKRPNERSLKQCLAAVDFKRLSPDLARRLVECPPYGSQRSLGSVALEWCWLAAGRIHLYLHGKQKLWDYAAGQLVLDEVKGYSQTLQGEPVHVSDVAPRSAIAALDEGLFEQWSSWLRG